MAVDRESFLAASSIIKLEPTFQAFVISNITLPEECTFVQLRTLFLLKNTGTLTLSEIASHLRCTKQHVSQSIPGMEEAGLVERSKRGNNRKNVHISITDKGIGVLESYVYNSSEYFGEAIKSISKEDKEQIVSCCNRLESIFTQIMNQNFFMTKMGLTSEEDK